MLTPYHTRYKAFLLQKSKNESSFQKYLPALMSARIDLHPHQIEAALFASQSPFSEGVILADEHGLGKTISAGIVLLDALIDNKKNLLVLCPHEHITHWKNELKEKFDIEAFDFKDKGKKEGIILLSYMQVCENAETLSQIPWDLCVLDEAHFLANDKISGEVIHKVLKGRRKLLLTATPMQNSLLDLYYLIRLVDDKIFGSSAELFKQKYIANQALKAELVSRIQMICQRTLRQQALTMQLPNRIVKTIMIYPSQKEINLSKRMSLYFHREKLIAFPKIQEAYIRLTYWKLLASSTQALTQSLEKVADRLEDRAEAKEELEDLKEVISLSRAIKSTNRSQKFLDVIQNAMAKLKQSGANDKIIVFSENNTTLAFLNDLLKTTGYKTVLSTPGTLDKAYKDFKTKAQILLAGDHFAKNHHTAFCNCVINYDVPWNVQKLERRITCCHTYGQKNDVLVVNFIDPSNRADKRLYTVLNKKLKKFDEVFGATETVLGDIHTIDDLQHTLGNLRTEAEIKAEQEFFATEHKEIIDKQMEQAQNDLLANFDESIAEKFKFYSAQIPQNIKELENNLWEISKEVLENKASIDEDEKSIFMSKPSFNGVKLSRLDFKMGANVPRGQHYTFNSPLAKAVINKCLEGELLEGRLTLKQGFGFQSGSKGIIGLWCGYALSSTNYTSTPILCGYMLNGKELTHEECKKIMALEVINYSGGHQLRDKDEKQAPKSDDEHLMELKQKLMENWQKQMLINQNEDLQKELKKLEKWAQEEVEGLKIANAQSIETYKALKEAKENAGSFAEKFIINKALADFEKNKQNEKKKKEDLAAIISHKKEVFMKEAAAKSSPRIWDEELFTIRFTVA